MYTYNYNYSMQRIAESWLPVMVMMMMRKVGVGRYICIYNICRQRMHFCNVDICYTLYYSTIRDAGRRRVGEVGGGGGGGHTHTLTQPAATTTTTTCETGGNGMSLIPYFYIYTRY